MGKIAMRMSRKARRNHTIDQLPKIKIYYEYNFVCIYRNRILMIFFHLG